VAGGGNSLQVLPGTFAGTMDSTAVTLDQPGIAGKLVVWDDFYVVNNAFKPGGGSWSSTSDARLKKNVHTLSGALDKLLALHGVSFEYIDPEKIHELSGCRMGLLAQEVEKVFPDWVETGADGYKRVTVRGLEALVVEALRQLRQEQETKIAGVKKASAEQAQEQHKEIVELKNRLGALEKFIRTPGTGM
jgi:hypothetical protein